MVAAAARERQTPPAPSRSGACEDLAITIEHEHKLLIPPGCRIPPPEDLLDGLGPRSEATRELVAHYFDTDDLRLVRSGITLRHRSDDGWTLKLPAGRDDDALLRHELALDAPPGAPPPAALDLVTAWARHRPLVEVARLTTHRNRTVLLGAGGRPLIELTDDRVDGVPTSSGATVSFRELEIETFDTASRAVADRIVERLTAIGATAADPRPKVARVLGAPADAPGDVEVPPLRRRAGVAETVRAAIAASVLRLLTQDPHVRLGDDPEAVHQMRVATRRLRSDLATFRPLLERDWSETLRADLERLGAALGRVRDADVIGAHLDRLASRLPAVDPTALATLTALVTAPSATARADLLTALRTDEYRDLLDALVRAARQPRITGHPDERARDTLPPLAWTAWRRLERFVLALPDHPTDAELHQARKRAKRARYACEAVGPVAPARLRRAARRLARLQELLGDHHDAVVLGERLAAIGPDATDPAVAFLAGELTAACRAEAEQLRAAWPPTWRAARRTIRAAFG